MTPSRETVQYDAAKIGALRTRPMHWMSGAVKRPGALRRKAHAAGESTMQFAHAHDTGSSRTAKQSRLAETFAKFRPKKKRGLRGRVADLRSQGAFRKSAA